MKKFNKLLPKIVAGLIVLVLISTVLLSSIYAKYVSSSDPFNATARPAGMELITHFSEDDFIGVDFAVDADYGAPIGHSVTTKNYDFSVRMVKSEVRSEFNVKLIFNEKVTARIQQARADKFKDGVWCDFRILMKNSEGEYVPLAGRDSVSSNKLTWVSNAIEVEPNKNPDGSVDSTDSSGNPVLAETDFRLEMIFYNNTTMPNPLTGTTQYGNGSYPTGGADTQDYFFSSNSITIEVSAKQTDPGFLGSHIYK